MPDNAETVQVPDTGSAPVASTSSDDDHDNYVPEGPAIEPAVEPVNKPVNEVAKDSIEIADTVMDEASSEPLNAIPTTEELKDEEPNHELSIKSPEAYTPALNVPDVSISEDGKSSNPFIIESDTEDIPAPNDDISIFKRPEYEEESDDDDEYEPSAPILPKKSAVPPTVPVQVPSRGVSEGPVSFLGPPASAPTGPAALRNTSNPKPSKHKRLALDTIGRLQDKIKDQPDNIAHWRSLVDVYKAKDKTDEVRETYEKAIEIFPLAAGLWVSYIEMELALDEFERVEKLFSRALTTVYSVKLWQTYLGYVLRINNIQANGEKAWTTIQQTYDFVLEKIGLDRDSGTIWAQYIDFVRSKETSTTWEQQQQMDSLRKIYRKAICIPLNNLETLWHGYNTFENSINKSTARKFLAEKSAIYMTARSSLRELQNITSRLDRSSYPQKRQWTRSEDRQIDIWRNWVSWEEKNPLESTDKAVIHDRITYAYRQAMMTMWFYPEIWFEAADYALRQDGANATKDALQVLNLGMKANSTSALLFFKAAEVLESSGNKEDANKLFKSLLDNLKSEYSKLEEKLKEFLPEGDDAAVVTNSPKVASLQKLLDAKAHDITFTYIAYMKAVKRMDGIAQARQVFSECRKLPYSTYQIYIASASMELRNDKPDIATKIFEIGLKRFSVNSEYIKEYIDFLIRINDDTNARALFEKSVTKIEPLEAKMLYKQFLDYEAKFGELVSLKKLEDRYKLLFPSEETSLDFFIKRFDTQNYNPIKEIDFGRRYDGSSSESSSSDDSSSDSDSGFMTHGKIVSQQQHRQQHQQHKQHQHQDQNQNQNQNQNQQRNNKKRKMKQQHHTDVPDTLGLHSPKASSMSNSMSNSNSNNSNLNSNSLSLSAVSSSSKGHKRTPSSDGGGNGSTSVTSVTSVIPVSIMSLLKVLPPASTYMRECGSFSFFFFSFFFFSVLFFLTTG